MKKSKISQIELLPEDIGNILKAMVFAGDIGENSVGQPNTPSENSLGEELTDGTLIYKLRKDNLLANGIAMTPCGICPVFSKCADGNVISPTTCVYMNDWLDF